MLMSCDLGNFELGSPNLRLRDLLSGPTYLPNFVSLDLTGAKVEIATDYLPPPIQSLRRGSTLENLPVQRANNQVTKKVSPAS